MKKYLIAFLLFILCSFTGVRAQEPVTIEVYSNSEAKQISPYIFGRNNTLSDNSADPLSESEWQRLRDLGINIFRDNGGNNSTKYNWRRKLSSHPDWYNNVYRHDWDFTAKSLQQNIPGAQGMWTFQLIGKAAKTGAYNFDDWGYNRSQWWDGVRQNLCGGGQVNPDGGENALVEGDTSLYMEAWTPDSTVGILDHWFAPGGADIDSTHVCYWNMDNEPEIWNGTHDDVWPNQPDAEVFINAYVETAKKARAKFPGIKLLGPVPANEWQWYNWNGSKISYNGKEYVWLEYFILRIAEEQVQSGMRLLDVLDIHFYPGETDPADIVQLHRIFFDRTYDYPGANGVRRAGTGSWDVTITKEYIFERCREWLEQYMGPDHGVTFAVSETGINGNDPNVTAVWYASVLGEFARQGVEIFTPWTWKTGMDEVLHLFSRYHQPLMLDASSSDETYVSAYPTISSDIDSMTLFLVNRSIDASNDVQINLSDFNLQDGTCKLYRLSGLPSGETFVSHSQNALVTDQAQISSGIISLSLPPLSVTSLEIRLSPPDSEYGYLAAEAEAEDGILTGVSVSTGNAGFSGTGYVTGFDNDGDQVKISISVPQKDMYQLVIRYNGPYGDKKQDVTVNDGFSSPVDFPATTGFEEVPAGKYLLEQGLNTVTIRKSWGWTDIDKIQLYYNTLNNYQVELSPVDPDAAPETVALYDYLKSRFRQNIISGQTHYNYSVIHDLTGWSPMIRTGDFQHFTEGYPYLWVDGAHTFGKHDDGSVDALIDWYNQTEGKGIISYQWHWHSPTGGEAGTNTFYTDLTDFDVTLAVTPGTEEYDLIIRDIDDIAAELKRFSDEGIPILWRPLHEAGGGWFWWGAKGPEACLALYDILYDRLMNYHQLHNLLWVWSTPEEDWYPGNEKIDIIGHDSYPGSFNYGSQKYAFDRLFNLTEGKKLIAMTENGPVPDPDACLDYDAPWAYFMSWSELVTEQNSVEHINEVYDNERVLKLGSDNNFNVSLVLLDEMTQQPFRGVAVTFNEITEITNDAGKVMYNVPAGNYNYSFEKVSYRPESGILDITSDTVVRFYLTRTHADLKIWLKRDETPIENAVVRIDSDSVITGALGLATFKQLQVDQTYHYNINREGYESEEGDIYLVTDTALYIQMVRVTSVGERNPTDRVIRLWPNPTYRFLNCKFPDQEDIPGYIITDMTGHVCLREDVLNSREVTIDLTNLSSGMYLLIPFPEYTAGRIPFIKF